jgi:Tol biopolymer transport system component
VVYRSEGTTFPFVQPVGWTPDSTRLLMVASRPDKTWVVGTVPANGGRFTPLRSFGWSYDWRGEPPRLSPDGRFVAYLEGEKGQRDVHVVSLDGRDTYRITDHPADDWGPVWSPDSRHLAFMSNRLGSASLWSVEVKDGKPVAQATKVKDGMQSARSIDWTGRGVFYDQQTTTWDLYTVPVDPREGRATGSPRPIAYSRTGRNVSPVWSPDGGRLAFVSSAASEPTRRYVVVMPADGSQAREFLIPTTSWEYPSSPPDLRWFGDGRGLGFSGVDTRGAPAVFRLVLATGDWDTIPLPHLAQAWQTRTDWNRDGSAFYFSRDSTSEADGGGIFERAVNSDAERLVYRAPPMSNIRGLEFSPDRKGLAFQQRTFEGAGTMISRHLVVNVETGDTRTALSLEGFSPNRLVGVTPAGDLLVALRGTGGTASEVLLAPVNGGAARSIAIPTLPPSAPGDTQPELVAKWSPTGRTMVLGRASRGAETFVIENPLAAVRPTIASR